MAAKPDFTTGWKVPFTKRGIEADKITAQNIPIFVPDSMQSTKADLDMVFADMVKFGEIFGVKDRAEAWVADQKKQLAAVQDKIAKLPHKRVFVFDSEDGEPFTVFEGYTLNLLRLIGADNVMSRQGVDKTWSKMSWESVVAADPEYIIIADYSTSIRNEDDFNQKVEKLKENPRLQGTTTVKENHFVRVKLSEITLSVRSVDALKRLAEQIHGVKID
ncbi:ABC transporter substrate-binding protein [uncultured Selenomonas sp.]|uniref:ABC transporter substrate-binding protein n=1 Tax=uncultured Selenomonas sp. TaxID=159275 RepID=UPI002590BFCE|nr:ABC transporter substrate-binding protein [uncultured Selenomonas sp.]